MSWEREEAAYRAYGRDLMRFAGALVGLSRAEDLVSTTLSSLLESRRWRDADDMRAYAMGALVRQAASMHRSTARRRRREQRAAGPEAVTDTEVTDPGLFRAVLGLSLRQRSVLYLAYWEDLTPTQIAQLLGISEGAVRRHLSRARQNLRRSLT